MYFKESKTDGEFVYYSVRLLATSLNSAVNFYGFFSPTDSKYPSKNAYHGNSRTLPFIK